jgi:hypothetical protein
MIRIARASFILCYLDFDGVLHDDEVYFDPRRGVYLDMPGRTLFEWAHILEELLMPYPEVKIVLSTSWVRMKSFYFAKSYLPLALQERVIGATYHHREMIDSIYDQMSRGHQVWSDVLRRKALRWFALDNDDSGWPKQCRGDLILTDDRMGLSDPAVQQQIRVRLAELSGHDE